MIPDKIYLVKDAANPEGIFDTVASKKPMFQDDICYIRKDALLEWLESKVYEHNEDRFDDGFNAALGQVIDKLNSM